MKLSMILVALAATAFETNVVNPDAVRSMISARVSSEISAQWVPTALKIAQIEFRMSATCMSTRDSTAFFRSAIPTVSASRPPPRAPAPAVFRPASCIWPPASEWLHEGLTQAGLPAICIETRQANAAMKTMPNKTDRNDARALAQIMRTGWFRQVHVKSRQCRLWRSLLVARRTILNEMRAIENVVRAILREAGIKLGTPSRTAFADRVREMTDGDASVTPLVSPLLAILAVMLRELGRLTKQVLAIVRQEKICRRLMSAPGVGPITALAYRATIDRPERFRHSRDVGAHLGLTPARYQSGETDIQGKISRCGDELARTALYRRRIACSCAARNGQACEHGA
ncbi:transposase [Rhodoblastus acidophilus]|nr:transposase [Rhodoblastus acidophilus]